jgi:hypothetical protein
MPTVVGQSDDNDGVQGFSTNIDRSGVIGTNTLGVGVKGVSEDHDGVEGFSKHQDRAGVTGTMEGGGVGVRGQTFGAGTGVHATSSEGTGLVASGGRLAASFVGDIEVSGDVKLAGADLAEQFDATGRHPVEPGCVVVLVDVDCVQVSAQPYDRRVGGVVSGAGTHVPALILDRRKDVRRRAIALAGKVWCKVDADLGPIEVGDMLTSSTTPGHAMHALDPARGFGAIIGKALGSLRSGRGLVPILVALQ